MDIRTLAPPAYPPALREIPQPPTRLWLRGALPPPEMKRLAVVGSRALSRYGKESCEYLLAGLAGYPISIISGLALGADACAHRAALAAGLHTVAVPGSGLADAALYPRANAALAADILAGGGALLSEQEPAHRARPEDFPSRNRLMVGLADAVLVIEAGPQSGTLITARLASEYNRDLLCVPHRIGDAHGFAAHLFLRLGAAAVSDPLHILEALRIAPHAPESAAAAPRALAGTEKCVYDALAVPRARDELIRASGCAAGEALTALATLELRGVIKEEFGAWRRVS